MKKRVYLETTIVSYLTARPSRDIVVAGKQQVTRQWWDYCKRKYDLFVSQVVIDEASSGDLNAAAKRMAMLNGIPLLLITNEAAIIGSGLIEDEILPPKAADDALHLAIAAVNDIDILLTWNCTHLANANLIREVERYILTKGFDPPVICTPEELLGELT